ncbi:flagellar biosynthesis protein [Novosphingobium sp. BL-52-GroH]|uniref:FliH/SctL family protein n=1 Tax=Novosphingobium sp. BL-52-GroH TaxID=3349877 RepID=UPI00384C134A
MDNSATIQPFGFDRVFHLVDAPLADLAPEGGLVLPAEDVAKDLSEKLAELEARIERLHADHRAELARARADGFEAGVTQARTERAEALLAATDALHAGLDDIEARFDAVGQGMVADAGTVALHAAELLAGHAVDSAPARAIDEALGRALDQVAQGTALVVRANPALRGEIARMVEARTAKAGRVLAITVVEDAGIAEGDARIEWKAGGLNVDAGERRAAVMAELAGVLSSSARENQ